jgi:hypothetical protein
LYAGETKIDAMVLRFAGGIETMKIVAPALGIPLEIGKQLYENYDHQQLPKSNT